MTVLNPDQPRFFVCREDGGNGGRRLAASGDPGASGCSDAATPGTQQHAHDRRIPECNTAGRDNTNGKHERNSRINRIDGTPAGRRWPNLPGSEDPGSRGKKKEMRGASAVGVRGSFFRGPGVGASGLHSFTTSTKNTRPNMRWATSSTTKTNVRNLTRTK
jgi:hypothetical protein